MKQSHLIFSKKKVGFKVIGPNFEYGLQAVRNTLFGRGYYHAEKNTRFMGSHSLTHRLSPI